MARKDELSKYKSVFYAHSILDIAQNGMLLESLEQEFKNLKEEIFSDKGLKNLLSDTSIKKFERLKTAFSMLKGNYGIYIKTLLAIMITMDMVKDIEDIYLAFIELVGDFKKQVYVEVVSAIKLDTGTLVSIKEDVDKNTGLDVRIKNTVDPEIMGGLVIKIGGKVIDLSIRSRFEDMRSKLKAIELRGEEFGTEN